jgi:hypothetical protein
MGNECHITFANTGFYPNPHATSAIFSEISNKSCREPRILCNSKYREYSLSTVSLSTIPGIVRFSIVVNSINF